MKSLTIGVDLDGVCYSFNNSLRRWLIERRGFARADLPESTSWHFYKDQWGMSLEDFIRHCNEAAEAGWLFSEGRPTLGAKRIIRGFQERGHKVIVITSRFFGMDDLRNPSAENTYKWIEKHSFPHDELIFSDDKTIRQTDIMIDDRLENYDALEAAGLNPWLFDQPWNQDNGERKRVYSWTEFGEKVRELENETGRED